MRSFHEYEPPTVIPPPPPPQNPDQIKVPNDGQNTVLIKVKLSIGLYQFVYDILNQNYKMYVVPFAYGVFTHTFLSKVCV